MIAISSYLSVLHKYKYRKATSKEPTVCRMLAKLEMSRHAGTKRGPFEKEILFRNKLLQTRKKLFGQLPSTLSQFPQHFGNGFS